MSRYVIYEMMGKEISFKQKGVDVLGICTGARREVLDNEIYLTVLDTEYRFPEPNKIEANGEEVVFVYGSGQEEDMVDFCGEELSVHWGEDIRKSIGREKAFTRMVFVVKELGKGE